jgi:transcriptional regulator with XRE-family HTH domain
MLNSADVTSRLSHSLALAREQRGLSQERVAELLNARGAPARRNEIRRWEHGQHRPSERNLLVLVDVLGHDLSWWYARHDDDHE